MKNTYGQKKTSEKAKEILQLSNVSMETDMLSSRKLLVKKNFVRKYSQRLDLSFSKVNYSKNVEIDGIEEKIKYSRIKNKEGEPGRVIVSR